MTSPAGAVETLAPDRVEGSLPPGPDGSFPLVDMLVFGHRVRSLRVLRVRDDGRGWFRLPLAESLLRYVGGPDDLAFVVDGTPLPVLENALPTRPGALGREAFEARLAEGCFVTKFGGLRLPLELDTTWQERSFAHYERARTIMLDLFGYDIHVAYGTLLGIEREGAFIDGDDDFDTTYHSRHTSVRAVRDELFDIASTLAARGEDVQLSGRKFIHWYHGGAKLDVFPAWSRREMYFQAHVVGGPYAHVYDAGYHDIQFKGRTLSAPVDAAGALAATYGPGWRTPDPSFQWRRQPGAERAMRAVRVTPGQLSLLQWERHWAAAGGDAADGVPGPSPFAHLAAARLGPRIAAVVDLGCGDGRDTLTVAGGRPALGLDGSRAAVAAARSRAGVEAHRVDLASAAALRAAIGPIAARGPVAVYARRVLECIEADAEAAVRRALRATLPPGSLVLIEIDTRPAPEPQLGTPLHRHVAPRHLVRRWTKDEHFAVELLEQDRDAHVARVVLRRRGRVSRRWRLARARLARSLRLSRG